MLVKVIETKSGSIEIVKEEIGLTHTSTETRYFVDEYEGRHEINSHNFSTLDEAMEWVNEIK